MEETTKILGLPIKELISMLEMILIISGITATITIQFLRLRKHKELFRKLSESFGMQYKKTAQDEIVEKIILLQRQRESKNGKIGVSEKIISYIHGNLKNYKIFVHFTSEKQNAEHVIKDGFKYSESIYKTSQEIIESSVDLNYKLQLYRPYGKYLIVICIPKLLFEISDEYQKTNNQFSLLDNILSDFDPKNNLEYTLPSIFVHAYIDMERNIIVENKSFLKEFNIEEYKSKIATALN